MPLYEAISNSIDAIEEHGNGWRNHSIRIKLFAVNDLTRQAGDETFVVNGFDVVDDGVGFNEINMKSFQEAHTLSKVRLGGRGIGRFTFLKVFDSVHVRSVFNQDGKYLLREFDFNIQDELKGADATSEVNEPVGTITSLRGMADKFISGWPTSPETIAQRIIAHFLIRFAARSCPSIVLESLGYSPIDLHTLFQNTVLKHIDERFFEVDGKTFALQAYRHKDGRARHDLHLCANGREVTTNKLRDLLPELPEKLLDDQQQSYTLIVLVTGEYLDENANQERTRISFQAEEEAELEKTLISRQSLNKGVTSTLRPLLVNDLKATNEEKRVQIERFVEKAPEYRALTHPRYKEIIEQKIQPGLSDDKLDEALLHVKRYVEDSVSKAARDIASRFESQTFEQYQDIFQEFVEKANDLGKAELAKYVTHRRTLLDLIKNSLKKKRDDDKYPLEKVLHQMIFPMGSNSKEIFFEQQNLWVIDERLCYHTLLISDKKLKSVPGLENTSGKEREPDIFAFFYDTPIGVAEPENLPGGGIVIIEFKRPGIDNYDKDPADQIIQRFQEISHGNVKDIDGRRINPENLRYMGYLIADLEPSLRRQTEMRYHKASDNEGYFYTLPRGNGYIEIISYNKLIKDAENRNRILFDKLGLHKKS